MTVRVVPVASIVALGLVACAPRSSVAPVPIDLEPPAPSEEPLAPEPEPIAEVEPTAESPPREPTPPVMVPDPDPPVVEMPPPGFTPIPAKRKKGFPGVPFAEVKMFAFDLEVYGQPVCESPLDPDGTPCKTVVSPGAVLDAAQTKSRLAMLAKKSTWGEGAACFLPHHGFVFYDAAGTPVAELSVCFMCNMMTASPAIPKARRGGEGGGYGLGEKSVAAMRALCTELGLPKCDATRPEQFGK